MLHSSKKKKREKTIKEVVVLCPGSEGWAFNFTCTIFFWFCNHSTNSTSKGCNFSSNQKTGQWSILMFSLQKIPVQQIAFWKKLNELCKYKSYSCLYGLLSSKNHSQVESAMAMRSMAPQIKAIQERYAGDQVNYNPSFTYFFTVKSVEYYWRMYMLNLHSGIFLSSV